jgi:hypothetical protein
VTAKTRSVESTATEVHSITTATPQRPTGTFTLGSFTCSARGPKMRSWLETANLLERMERAEAAEKTLREGGITSAYERRDLEKEARESPTTREVHLAVIEGEHGFLRKALAPEDFQKVIELIDDDEDELDIPELYEETMRLFIEFAPWYTARADAVGIAVPELQETRKRAKR